MGNARQLGRAQAAAAFNLERAGGEGERGLRPLPLAESDLPLLLNTRPPSQARRPLLLLLWELQARAAGRNSATAGVGRRHSGQPECSGILHETLPRGEPQEAERSWPPPAWPGWASEDAPYSCPPWSLPGVMKRLGPAVRVKGLKRTAWEFSALFRAQFANFLNMSHHRLLFTLRLIVQALREPILNCQTLRRTSNRPQRTDPIHATLEEKKTPVALSQGCCSGTRKTQIFPHPGNEVWSLIHIYTGAPAGIEIALRLRSGPGAGKGCFPLIN